jgi:hypothetical protein
MTGTAPLLLRAARGEQVERPPGLTESQVTPFLLG